MPHTTRHGVMLDTTGDEPQNISSFLWVEISEVDGVK